MSFIDSLDDLDENTNVDDLDKTIDKMQKEMDKKYKELLSENDVDSEE
jgi:hypothetical protein